MPHLLNCLHLPSYRHPYFVPHQRLNCLRQNCLYYHFRKRTLTHQNCLRQNHLLHHCQKQTRPLNFRTNCRLMQQRMPGRLQMLPLRPV